MKISKRERLITYWVLKNLRMYGNCACGYDLVKKHGRKKLLRTLDDFGYKCTLRIVLDPKEIIEYIPPEKKMNLQNNT